MKKQLISSIITTLALTGCGGGSDSSSNTPAPEIKTGIFTDSPVKGLFYETKTQSGLTNESGEFNYLEGETITFKLGGSVLGISTAQETITPFTISGVKALTKQREITNSFLSQTPNSYEKAINIATLLQGLDKDGDHDNGIDLGDAHTNLSNLTIPLLVKASGFESNTQYLQARSTMQTLHTLRFIDAAENMYESLGITIESNLTAKQTNNLNNAYFESIEFEYDNEGRVSTINFDRNNDGESDTNQAFTYDQNSRLQTIYSSANDTTQTLSYDTNNKLLSRSTVIGITTSTDESFEYQNNFLSKFSLDKTSDGVSDFNTTFSYDGDNNVSGYEIDSDGDLQTDKAVALSVQNGQVKKFTETSSDNSSLEISYKFNSKGNRTLQNIRVSNDDSTSNTNAKFSYDAYNNPSRYELDKDFDGKPDYIESYKYNQNKQRTQYRRDNDADGKWDFVAQYFYDLNGNRIKMLEDSDGNGVVDKKWEADYQAAILQTTWDDIANNL
tara:strand:- start:415 stop:1917 length:1503 start_codon:yes stop_codon:yes gene_type:complete